MSEYLSSLMERAMTAWIGIIERNHVSIIVVIITLTLLSVFYIKDNLGMRTSTRDMLSEELPWRQLDLKDEKLFPQFLDNLLIVIEAKTPDQASDTAQALYLRLRANPKLLNDIYYPQAIPYFRQAAFLFLEQGELQDLSDQLATIQPFLGTLLQDKNLRGLFNMLSDALNTMEEGELIDLKPLLDEINRALEKQQYQLSWQKLMSKDYKKKSVYREFIMLQVEESDADTLPNDQVIKHIRSLIKNLNLDDNKSIRIRLTGGTVLSNEELKSVSDTNIQAIIAAIILVAIILTIGLGSVWLVFSCLLTLLMGLIATTAFATATVGELNLISVSFAVLYIGLGIDFAIHLTLRYRERILISAKGALKTALSGISRALILCAITTAIGFYSFVPTDYKGVAELGWIAGSGIFISMIYTFILLPALLSLKPYKPVQPNKYPGNCTSPGLFSNLPYDYPKHILISALVLSLVIISQIGTLRFDTNTLNLQDSENESVQTYRDLLNDSDSSPWRIILLKKGRDNALAVKKNIEKLDLVDKVLWIEDLVPEEQEEKLFIIDDMTLFMGSLQATQPADINYQQRLTAISQLQEKLNHYSYINLDNEVKQLGQNLKKLIDSKPDNEHLARLEAKMLNSLDGRIRSLNDALNAEDVTEKDMPDEMSSRWINNTYYRLQVLPKENLNDNEAMQRFVDQIQQFDDEIIGSPVISIEAGKAVISAFQWAFSCALIAITLFLFVFVKVKPDAIIILISVLLGTLFTFGFMLLFNIPLNFANMIGLPLLLGIGVDSGIHISDRFRQEGHNGRNIFLTSSSRGVIVSSLTTIFSIGSLAFSSHVGTASMGLLLATGLISMMISTMLVLPTFLIWQSSLGKN